MRFLAMLLCSMALTAEPTCGGPPAIVGPPTEDTAAGVVRVQVGNPPWVPLVVKDAPPKSVQTWSGPIGPGQVGAYTRDGVGCSTPLPGTYPFRCIVQTPNEGLDTILILDITVIVEGAVPTPPGPGPTPPGPAPKPVPPVPPQPNIADKITEAVKAHPDAKLAGVAEMYETVGNQAGSMTIPQIQAAHQLSSALSPAWATICQDIVDPYLKTLTLAKAGDYAPVWHQIAAGIKAGLGPQPPPNPVDPPKPVDPVVPPIPVTSLHVLIIEETNNRGTLPAAQAQIFTSTKVLGWLKANCGGHWRIWDTNVDPAMAPSEFQAALRLPRTGLPWVIISNGTTGFSGPLPANETDTLTLLGKYKP